LEKIGLQVSSLHQSLMVPKLILVKRIKFISGIWSRWGRIFSGLGSVQGMSLGKKTIFSRIGLFFERKQPYVLSISSSQALKHHFKPFRLFWQRIKRRYLTPRITLGQFHLAGISLLTAGLVIGTYVTLSEVIIPRLRALTETTTSMPTDVTFNRELTGELAGYDDQSGAVAVLSDEVRIATSSAWWDGGYLYKKSVTMKNLGTEPMATTSAQVMVNTKALYDAGKIQANCEDLRVTYTATESANLRTEIPRSTTIPGGYTNCADSIATTITFPVQSTIWPNGGTDTNYEIYYGNSNAADPGYGDDGFNLQRADGSTVSATLVCPFNGTTTCADGETPTTETGAIRYSGAGGSALSFDGSGDTVNFGRMDDMGITDQLTVEGWIYIADESHYSGIWGDNNSVGLNRIFYDGSKLRFGLNIDTALGNKNLTYSAFSEFDQWVHVAGTYDGSNLSLFVNGEKVVTGSGTGNIGFGTNNNYYVGAAGAWGVKYMKGNADEFRISDTVRYTENFTPQTTPFEPDENTLILYHFDENGDDPRNAGKAIDASGNGNHGTINGAKYVSGLVGVDSSSSDTGNVPVQSYAGHQGIFIEEGTTNLITNPSFENSTTYNKNWGTNYFNYATASATFSEGVAKRNGGGPFAQGVMVGGETDGFDRIDFSLGTKLGESLVEYSLDFYNNIDLKQGSLVMWWTPNESSASIDSGYAYLFYPQQANSDRFFVRYNYSSNRFEWVANGNSGSSLGTKNIDLTEGETYLVVLSWDYSSALGAHSALSVDNDTSIKNHYQLNNGWPGSLYLGHKNGAEQLDGIIEGLTIYRRPLFDGTYGIDVGNGDEIEQIYNSGTGKDPTLVTGSWDVVFALPTDASSGEITTGTGNAWSHPHSSNLLYTDTTNTGGFMMNGTYTADGWADEGTPTSVAALDTSEKIFSGGYKFTSDAANEGIYYEKSVNPGDDFVIRGLAHSDGTSIPKIILYDQTNDEEIGSLTGTADSRRGSPDTFIITGEAPDGKARGWISLTGQPADSQTVTIGSTVYTFKTDISGTPGAGEIWVLIGAAYTNTADNLRRAITNAGVADTNYKYGSGATAHTQVTASVSTGDVTVTAITAGAAGNSVALSETADNTTVNAATLSGGKLACTTIRVKLVNTEVSGTTYWHQVEVLDNLIDNPSMESGSGDPWIPTGWMNSTLDSGDSMVEESDSHTNRSIAMGVNVETGDIEGMHSNQIGISSGGYYGFGTWLKGIEAGLVRVSTSWSSVNKQGGWPIFRCLSPMVCS